MPDIETEVREKILHADIKILQNMGCSDKTMEIMVAEHACRVETLSKALVDPGMAKAMLLVLARKFLDCANEIDDRTVVVL